MLNIFNKKESFTPTYFDSEEYRKQNISKEDQTRTNTFSPAEQINGTVIQKGYNNEFANKFANNGSNWTKVGYPVADNQELQGSQADWIQKNSLYVDKKINGVPLKDYYETYTNNVLNKGMWFLNKDMPQDTKQYLDDSIVQQRMEIYTGIQQQRDRDTLGKPNKTEVKNLFTPEERITTYGYQFGLSGQGPGLSITRQKELEELKKGLNVETEHTKDKKTALKIAIDHLWENPKYYTKLAKAKL